MVTRQEFLDRTEREIIILDGGMGTLLQARGLGIGQAPEEFNLVRSDVVEQAHREFVQAGSKIILTNTFGGTSIKLDEYNLGSKAKVINEQAVKIARRAAKNSDTWVAGCIGPCGKYLKPVGKLDFAPAYHTFAGQVKALAGADVDLLIIETMSDIREARAAMMAARHNFDGPIIAQMTFADGRNTVTGTDPLTALTVFEALDADAFGINCSTGPEEIFDAINLVRRKTTLPLVVEPNAGMPRIEEGRTCFPASPEHLAKYAKKFVAAGVNVIGACCGAGPTHIKAISDAIQGLKPLIRKRDRCRSRLSSRDCTIEICADQPIRMIGERINPTGRKKLRAELREGKFHLVRQEAIEQAKAGADVLDINVGVPGINEPETMRQVIKVVQQAVNLPICIDSSNPEAIRVALEEIEGKPLINSTTAEDDKLDQILPLAKHFGAAVLGLTLDENGIPETAEERLKLAQKIVRRGLEIGLRHEDIFIDPLTLTISAEPKRSAESLRTLRMIHEQVGVATVMGVSNVSYGLPNRALLNRTFLSMALQNGLDLPILNPFSESARQTIDAANVLLNRDRAAKKFISNYGHVEEEKAKAAIDSRPLKDRLYDTILYGNREMILELIDQALNEGWEALGLNEKVLIPALQEVGRRYDKREFFLPQVILAAETMQDAFKRLKELFPAGEAHNRGKIILATVKGDVHDIGKNIVAVVLENYGYEVINLGKNVNTRVIIEAAAEEKAKFVGLSALMTTTMVEMGRVVHDMREAGIPAKVIVGGAVVNKSFSDEIGADGYGKDAMEAVKIIDLLLNGKA
ncbi:homocysteine methyltransferase [candidate division LCP-89 bacterium B3_LCP]|uniref:Methionine synthase n=1 Tax=candidate division LCP-89 bacterium B3_LCP TaxID=2012998 RepID=A0A532UTZ9_UNCL8|nr:MAG: homocysteine methyltransferase [candidate division LCP-89 bacterium B3_LCP]